jgi:hypothetical protein
LADESQEEADNKRSGHVDGEGAQREFHWRSGADPFNQPTTVLN